MSWSTRAEKVCTPNIAIALDEAFAAYPQGDGAKRQFPIAQEAAVTAARALDPNGLGAVDVSVGGHTNGDAPAQGDTVFMNMQLVVAIAD